MDKYSFKLALKIQMYTFPFIRLYVQEIVKGRVGKLQKTASLGKPRQLPANLDLL